MKKLLLILLLLFPVHGAWTKLIHISCEMETSDGLKNNHTYTIDDTNKNVYYFFYE